MSSGEKKEKVVIAGGGLVGALAASAFADSGHEGKKKKTVSIRKNFPKSIFTSFDQTQGQRVRLLVDRST